MSEAKSGLWVIASGDEGLQLNSGVRLGFAGAGYTLPHFSEAVDILRGTLAGEIYMASAQEDDWLARALQSKNQSVFDETIQALAAENQLTYVGQFDFGDPKDLEHGVRGHLVRPPKIHVAEAIVLTVGGGEQVYSLEQLVISAEYAYRLAPEKLQVLMNTQIDFYRQVVGVDLPVKIVRDGVLAADVKKANETALASITVVSA